MASRQPFKDEALDLLAEVNRHRPKMWKCPACHRRFMNIAGPLHADHCGPLQQQAARRAASPVAMKRATLYMARLETSNFEFMAFGETAVHARAAMQRLWERHAAQTSAHWGYADVVDDVSCMPVSAGQCFRDRELFVDLEVPRAKGRRT